MYSGLTLAVDLDLCGDRCPRQVAGRASFWRTPEGHYPTPGLELEDRGGGGTLTNKTNKGTLTTKTNKVQYEVMI